MVDGSLAHVLITKNNKCKTGIIIDIWIELISTALTIFYSFL